MQNGAGSKTGERWANIDFREFNPFLRFAQLTGSLDECASCGICQVIVPARWMIDAVSATACRAPFEAAELSDKARVIQ
jgi:hypothetical protein